VNDNVGFCDHGYETSELNKKNFLTSSVTTGHNILKEDSAPWN